LDIWTILEITWDFMLFGGEVGVGIMFYKFLILVGKKFAGTDIGSNFAYFINGM